MADPEPIAHKRDANHSLSTNSIHPPPSSLGGPNLLLYSTHSSVSGPQLPNPIPHLSLSLSLPEQKQKQISVEQAELLHCQFSGRASELAHQQLLPEPEVGAIQFNAIALTDTADTSFNSPPSSSSASRRRGRAGTRAPMHTHIHTPRSLIRDETRLLCFYYASRLPRS